MNLVEVWFGITERLAVCPKNAQEILAEADRTTTSAADH